MRDKEDDDGVVNRSTKQFLFYVLIFILSLLFLFFFRSRTNDKVEESKKKERKHTRVAGSASRENPSLLTSMSCHVSARTPENE